jgi:hypothetical protein
MTTEITFEQINQSAKDYFGSDWGLLTRYQKSVICYQYFSKKKVTMIDIAKAINMSEVTVGAYVSAVRKEIDICREKNFRRPNQWIK